MSTDIANVAGRLPAALGVDGFIKASLWGAMGTALTETAGQIAAAFTKFFNKATPTGTVNSLPDAVAGAASGLPIGHAGYKKNTERLFIFVMTDSTNHAPTAGYTVTATRSLDGAAFGACANAVAAIASGVYKITLAAADLNADVVALRFTAAGADDLNVTIKTQA
jgi:hypothetical protein